MDQPNDYRRFQSAPEVRAFLKEHDFFKVSVRYGDNPFGGEGKYLVKLMDIPKGTCLIHSSGGQQASTTYTDKADVSARIGKLREVLSHSNTIVNH